MTTVTATHVPGGSFSPDGFSVDITGAPVPPSAAYASNFTSGVDSWSGFGTGVGLVNDTAPNPDALHLTGPANTSAAVHGARTVSGLTIGVTYGFTAYVNTVVGQCKLAVRNATEGTEFAQGSYVHTAKRTKLALSFVATATSHVIELFARTPTPYPTQAASLFADTVRVDPTSTWLGTTVVRTDANGASVPVRNPNALDVNGVGALTLRDYEAAMVGPVTYTVTDGTGATATVTASAAATHSNRVTNPIVYDMGGTASPWAGTGCTVTAPGGVAVRGTLTTATASDLAQRIATPTPPATGYLTRGEYAVGDPFQVQARGRCSLATIAGANVQMRQVTTPFNGSSGTSLTAANFSTLPVAGDVLVVYARINNATTTLTGVSGCGATWSRLTPAYTSLSFTHEWWIGVGGNATGNATMTFSTTKGVNTRGWLIGGLTSNTVNVTQAKSASAGTSLTGTAVNAQSGQIVLQAASFEGSSGWTYPNPATPSTGWTYGTQDTDAIRGCSNTGYRIPTELTPTSHNATVTSAGSNRHVVENVVLGVAVVPTTPTPHLKTRLTWYDSLGGTLGAVDSNIVTVSDVLWGDMLIDTTVPAAAESFTLQTGIEGTVTRSVGDWFEVQTVLAGRPGVMFSGESLDVPGYEYAWAGTPHASPSLEISTAPATDTPPSLTLPATALLTSNTSPPEFAELTMATDYTETTESPAAVHNVLGRTDKLSNPAPMLARTGDLTLWCADYPAAVAVRDLLKSPQTALFRQANYPGMDLYFIARQVDLDPAEPTPTRRWFVRIAYDEIPRPQ